MKPFLTSLMGSLPRSKDLMALKRELKNDNSFLPKYQDELKKEYLQALNLQERCKIDILTSGELDRDNYVSFVASKLNGVSELNMADLIEFMPNKKAFEKTLQILDVPSLSIKNAICTGKISRNTSLVADEMKFLKSFSNKPLKATLPGAYLLTRSLWLEGLSSNFYKNKTDLSKDILKVLKDELMELANLGVSIVQFDEPVLSEVVFLKGETRSFMCAALSTRKDTAPELEFASNLIKEITNFGKNIGLKIGLHVCRGNWSKDESILLKGSYLPLIELFEDILPDILFLEFSTPRAGEIKTLLQSTKISQNCILGLGVINPRNNEIESVEFILNLAKKALKFIPKEKLWLNPDCGFATFANRPVNSFKIIEKKLNILNLAKKSLQKSF
ncbi:cobalamin-independent methionine synthase II family protein [Campylobacter ureolyticus]|uniref:cobalamin-independent methionine synthase II family protein n=1 Tax=Campylobacter ureolyticus TaxID=827 RepID=UPI0022B51DEE|nr:cobalamin-independent methionine synthase II family protein [Campylobacter ureolyticus]MCZ6149995.1 cobalamin-independent methionine synthase II family protein [Campylobacter ureolyticus]